MTNGQNIYSVEMQDKGMMHVLDRTVQDGTRFHHGTQNGLQYKTYKLFTSGSFHLIFSDCCSLPLTETMESKTEDEKELLCPRL